MVCPHHPTLKVLFCILQKIRKVCCVKLSDCLERVPTIRKKPPTSSSWLHVKTFGMLPSVSQERPRHLRFAKKVAKCRALTSRKRDKTPPTLFEILKIEDLEWNVRIYEHGK